MRRTPFDSEDPRDRRALRIAILAVRGGAFVLLAALVALTPGLASAQDWTVAPSFTSQTIRDFQRTPGSGSYLVGDGGLAAVAADATLLHWNIESIGTTANLRSVNRISSAQVWVGGEGGVVRRSSATGWNVEDIATPQDLVAFSRTSGWSFAAGSNGSIWRTTDAGNSWALQSSGTTQALNDGDGFVGTNATVVGDGGTILQTTNGGVQWTARVSGTTADLNAFADVAGSGVLAVGDAGTVLRSSDGGVTWGTRDSGTTADLHDIARSGLNSNWLIAVGAGGTILRTTDSGESWCQIGSGTNVDLFAAGMPSNNQWVVAGAGGYLAVTTTSGGGCAVVDAPEVVAVADGFELAGPWPQPVRENGTFRLSVGRTQHVTAEVFDLAGRRVSRLLDGDVVSGGRAELSVDSRDWAAGVYFLRVRGEDFITTRRVVVAR